MTPDSYAPVIEVRNVRKTYGEKVAVDDVSFAMPPDAILGLLGPNGAGKTSLIRMITTITAPDSGQIYFSGKPLSGYHPTQIGYLPEERGLYKQMYVGEQLMYLGQLKGMSAANAESKAREWLAKFELEGQWRKKTDELSKGMQQQVQFIATVLHDPKLLILDEPFSGLDPVNANRMRAEILRMHADGTAVIFSTHRMEQVEELCEFIVLINHGRNILQGRVQDIRREFLEHRYRLTLDGPLPREVGERHQLLNRKVSTVDIQLQPHEEGNDLLRSLLSTGVRIQGFHELLPSLNEIFIKRVSRVEQPQALPHE